jgi:hypothetical protein
MTRFQRLRNDESGMSYVFIGMGMMAFLSASMLAIDVGMLMTARNQAQNSADAGALAGAAALAFNDFDDRSPTGPAVTFAVNTAVGNQVMARNVSVYTSDVEFLTGSNGEQNRVKVTVRRTASRDNPVDNLIAAVFKIYTTDIGATATAEVSPANAMNCVLPFTIPDRWTEVQTPVWDPDDGFDMVDKKGKAIPNPDVYIDPRDETNYTGYNAERDKGLQITLKADNGSKIAPSFYQAWDLPGSNNGADDYREAISGCRDYVMGFGDTYVAEPGMMSGPTKQGMEDLIAQDPDAYWDTVNNKVVSSKHPSPRVRAIPLFDPVYYDTGKRQGKNAALKFVNYLGFFVERMQGDEVVGRITPIAGLRKGAGFGEAPEGAFPVTIRLVE